MEPTWLHSDIELVNNSIQTSKLTPYKLKNPVQTISRLNDPSYIQKAQKALLANITRKGCCVIGLDCEWDWRNPASQVDLIQIATTEVTLLFHQFDRLPPELIKILKNAKIKKVGVNVKDDLSRISTKFDIEINGAWDLRQKNNESLAAMTTRVLGCRLDKSDYVRRSNWGQILTPRQIEYAAADAEVSLLLYHSTA